MATAAYHGTVCKTCRRRGRKCDKRLPTCSTCRDKGIICEGYTFRWAGVASRGKLAGMNIPIPWNSAVVTRIPGSSGSCPCPQRHESPDSQSPQLPDIETPPMVQPDRAFDQINEYVTDVPSDDPSPAAYFQTDQLHPTSNESDSQQSFILPSFEPYGSIQFDQTILPPTEYRSIQSIGLPRTLAPLSLPSDISFILEYYATESAPRLSVDIESPRNPYMEYILPLAIHVPSLLYACAALASCQFDIRFHNEDYRLRSLKFRGKAIKRLQESLYSDERAKEDGTLASILMLALCDISLGGSAGFDTHFLGARQLIDLRRDQRTPDSFVEQYLAWLDTMSAASQQRYPVFSSKEISELTATPDLAITGWSFDVFPCPIDQFEIIHGILSLYKSQTDPSSPSGDVLLRVAGYKSQVLSCPMELRKGEAWLHLAEAYRFAIVLYMLRLFRCGHDADEIAWLTGSVFYHAKATVPSTGWANQLLWPLFHAALEIRDEARKDWVRERAKSMQFSGGFRNVESAMMLLESVWEGESPSNYMDLVTNQGEYSMMFVQA